MYESLPINIYLALWTPCKLKFPCSHVYFFIIYLLKIYNNLIIIYYKFDTLTSDQLVYLLVEIYKIVCI